MSLLRYLSSLLLTACLCVGCGHIVRGSDAVHKYYIHPDVQGRALDSKMSDYLKKHLQRRSESSILDRNGIEVSIHVANDFGGDFGFSIIPGGGYELRAKDERTMVWLVYQFIKMVGKEDKGITTDDLPPLLLSGRDTVVTFPFQYRDLYLPANQNYDMTYLLALNNLEMDWGLWGHNLSRVLGGNGDTQFGLVNMDQELFARANGMQYQNQFCFSSDKLMDLTVQYIMDNYGDGSNHPVNITIGPNDNDVVCLCRRCETAGNTLNNATPALVNFVERLAVRFPGHTFFIPGYSTTAALPNHVLPANVGVFLSAIDYPRRFNDADSPEARTFFNRLRAWKAITNHVYIWDYICNFDDYLSPFPVLNVMQNRLRRYREEGVQGIFLNGSGYFYSLQQELHCFVLSSLLINPDADIPSLVNDYFADAMPHLGAFFSSFFLELEKYVVKNNVELPLYAGMEEVTQTYLSEKDFRELYKVLLKARDMEMTHRERVIYEKIRQFLSFTFLEMCRLHGLSAGGVAERVGTEWVVKPEVWFALEDLKMVTPEDDIVILTDNEEISMDHMDRVNESGVYIADYENEMEAWLSDQPWNLDLLLRQPLTIRYDGKSEQTTVLTDGIAGISQNYHWGWNIYPQKDNITIELPVQALSGHSGTFSMSFLNSERHRMAPPKSVEVWVDGRSAGVLRREGLSEYVDEGEKVIFRGQMSIGYPQQVELRLIASHTRNVAIDEIVFK